MDGRPAPCTSLTSKKLYQQQILPDPSMVCSPDSTSLNIASHMNVFLGKAEECACETFCQSLQQNIEPDLDLCSDANPPADQLQQHSGGSCRSIGRVEARDPVSARKVHKADREKLRRDRLNEHFVELAGALDPDRPKNDKATILGDSIQVLRELSAEVKRLRAEHTSLMDESHDLAQEKNELHDEKELLKNEVEQLQCQIQQHMRTSLSWMTMDPSVMMGLAAFPYPVPVPQPSSISAEPRQSAGQAQMQQPFMAPNPYIPLPIPPSLALYAGLQGYFRHSDGSNMFFPYLPYTPAVNSSAHVDRPFAQYPSLIQPSPGYPVQTPSNQGRPSVPAFVQGSSYYRSHTPSIPIIPTQYQRQSLEKQESSYTGTVGHHMHTGALDDGAEVPSIVSDASHQDAQGTDQDSCQHVHTTLQLQTPTQCCSASAQSQQASAKFDQAQDPNLNSEEKERSSPSQQPIICNLHHLGSESCVPASQSSEPLLSGCNNSDTRRETEGIPDNQVTAESHNSTSRQPST